jgi:hypothetical protein
MPKILVRRGLDANIPVFDTGEPGLATDTKRVFIGSDEGNIELYKVSDMADLTNTVSTHTEEIGNASGRLDQVDTTLAGNTKKIKGFINIAEYNVVGDGVTDDLTPIINAVADAKTNGYALNWGWDGKAYLTTATIPDFHKVKHIGNAIIKRGSDLFYISPQGVQRNKIYVDPTGSNTNDGLSSSQPVRQLYAAVAFLPNYGPVLTGYWEFILSAGTHDRRTDVKMLSENPIEFTGVDVGGHPNVPTTIISEGTGISAVGLSVSDRTRIIVRNVKLIGFNGSSSSAALKASNGSEITTSNVHTDSCYWGVSGENRSNIVIPDGIHSNHGTLNTGTGTGAAIRSLQLNRHAIGIQNNGNQTNTALFKNCYQAIFIQESSTGHVDWCTIQDCTIGVVARVKGRANVDGTLFKRNGVDIRREDGNIYVSSNTVFSTGADESTNKIVSVQADITNNTMISGKELAYTTVEKALDTQYLNQTVATTSNTVVYTATLKAPLWRGTPTTVSPMKKLYFRIYGTINGANSNKRIYVRLGSALLGVTYAAADNGTFTADGYIYFTGADTQYLFMKSNRHLGTSPKQSKVNGTNVMTADVNLTIEGQVDNTGDNIVFEMIEVGIAG